MKNIIAYSMEKLYKDLEEADELFSLIRDEGHGIVREAACGGCKKGCSRAHGSPLQRHGSYAV